MPDKEHPIAPAVPSVFDHKFEPRPIALSTVSHIPGFRAFIAEEDLAAAQRKFEQIEGRIKKFEREEKKGKNPKEVQLLEEHAAKALADARCNLASLTARWKADRYRYSSGKDLIDSDNYQILKREAAQAEQAAKLAAADLAVLTAEQKLQKLETAQERDETAIKDCEYGNSAKLEEF